MSAAFVAAMEAERDLVKNFLDILYSEQEMLSKGEAESLPALAQGKTELAVRLSQLAGQRNHYLLAQGLSPDRKGMETWLAAHPDAAAAAPVWRELLALAEAARQQNQANGMAIGIRLSHNRQALELLQSAARSASLYRPDGQTDPLGGGRSIGTA